MNSTSEAQSVYESAHDILRSRGRPLDVFFNPSTVAVIGASEKADSVGRTLLWNLLSNPFGGTVFPVSLKRASVLGIRAYRTISEVPEPVDLAVVVTPASAVPDVIGQCAEVGVKGAIIISAGFKETGPAGLELEREVLARARRGNMRIVGPNCLGVMNPRTGLNATFAQALARPGKVAFISQSGALCTAILDWSLRENVGFSAFVSIGSMLDVGWGDIIDHLADDPHTESILLYMESVGNARAFLSAAREAALSKPIIIIKVGRTEQAAQAAASHTGSLTGSDDVLNAAFTRCGVLRVDSIEELFNMAEIVAKQPSPRGRRVAIVTNAGGPGALATDALIGGQGQLAPLSEDTLAGLNQALPPHWSHGNPVDILGDADAERYAKAVDIVARDPNTDGLLIILTLQAMTDSTKIAEQLGRFANLPGKPIVASWMGGAGVAAGEAILNRANIPTFAYPDAAARAFNHLWRYGDNLRALYETPSAIDDSATASDQRKRRTGDELIDTIRQTGRTLLTEWESKRLLASYGIPTVETHVATKKTEAVRLANKLGYPAVLKLHSESITHKTDVGGVHLNLDNAGAVRNAWDAIAASVREKGGEGHFQGVTVQRMVPLEGYELILGSSLDPQFGPVLLFGWGGQLVEVFKDRALALPPLNTTLARRMMEHTRIYQALQGVRGRRPVDLAALEQLLVRFSQLIVEQRRIKEIDINPLLASSDRLLALDARVVLHESSTPEDLLPPLAIRPYPVHYTWRFKPRNGKLTTLRPIRPEDEPLIVRFHQTLSETSVYQRYFHQMGLPQRVAHERLVRVCFNDYDREIALVAERTTPANTPEIVAVGRLMRIPGTQEAEFAMMVADPHQGRGLGKELLRRLVEVARGERLHSLRADLLARNHAMLRLCQELGFILQPTAEGDSIRAHLVLQGVEGHPSCFKT